MKKEKNNLENIELLRLTTSGSVDNGKSTLIGRLLYDCNEIFEDHLSSIKDKNGKLEEKKLSSITDGLSAEREQDITIDVAYRHFSRPNRKFIIADVPGHEQYTRNMVTGSSMANLAIILIDVKGGLLVGSKRHLFIVSLLGIPHILVVINKMDLVEYNQDNFRKIKNDFIDYVAKLNIHDLQFIPVSALKGDMVVSRGKNMSWYDGQILLNYLENASISSDRNLIDFRFPVQYVVKSKKSGRVYCGKIEGGSIKRGDKIIILPSKIKSTVKSIYLGQRKIGYAFSPQSVAISLEDEIDVSRGCMIVRENNLPIIKNNFKAMICWFSEEPLECNKSYLIKHSVKTLRCSVSKIYYKINIENLHQKQTKLLKKNDIGRISIETNEPLYFDVYQKNKNTGSFILIDEITNNTVGAGIIISKGEEKVLNNIKVRNRKAPVLWFTGLPSSGKSTISRKVAEIIKKKDKRVESLDGDIVRESLTRDLGFSKEDRFENTRRVGFLAKYLSRNGVYVVASFVSPYKKQRDELKKMMPNFVEIHVDALVETCEKRDVKNMYKKARAGKIKNFTGVSDSYEKPNSPDIYLKTDEMSIKECVEKVINYLKKKNLIK